ncbi:RsmB/NOP family class I SAM-dependent RNA methyltransferase [Methylocystis parvus]|uniref:RsmB/NOP family class I SAM-dependent RNA methyltransferase n=1 Tax=Methylocystis parvus TaxID=134 RepID=A0A6B8MD93_9HYPH|nr:RsmB/NOP family class I SAM-dependent RNA methyltransferase [Methylocystis parvus]QGM98620.1 RsmB/NOP family class I SAM-dependent RNA methyltransferase [Methylocystis parvus]WBK01034.1 RsmB/NOP family class I SAM-dependent RNA methyltransferase [Methylocystis parvus OBBP]
MIPAAQVSAAIEILDDLAARRRPVADALKDWGASHRFAGSKDRAAIASLVFDALRKRASAAWIMGSDTARATMLGALREARGQDAAAIAALCTGERHAPPPLSEEERARLETATLDDAPDHVKGDYPEWLAERFAAAFGDRAAAEGAALAARAPVDLRANILKASREQALAKLAHLAPIPTPLSPIGLRIEAGQGRGPALPAETAYVKGLVEPQDEASQLAALLCAAAPGEQVLDLCAGGGGKALALAGQMHNKGQLYAYDADGRRLMPIHERLERAGARNIQVRQPKGKADVLADLEGRCDLVLIDAPCTGTGTWRRHPDAKWRLAPGALELRLKEQAVLLEQAVRFVRPGGRLAYVTCSLLREENEDQMAGFLAVHADFAALPGAETAERAGLPDLARFASPHGAGVRLSPASSGADGFYVCVMRRGGNAERFPLPARRGEG